MYIYKTTGICWRMSKQIQYALIQKQVLWNEFLIGGKKEYLDKTYCFCAQIYYRTIKSCCVANVWCDVIYTIAKMWSIVPLIPSTCNWNKTKKEAWLILINDKIYSILYTSIIWNSKTTFKIKFLITKVDTIGVVYPKSVL